MYIFVSKLCPFYSLRYLEKHGTDVVNEEPYVLYKASLQVLFFLFYTL